MEMLQNLDCGTKSWRSLTPPYLCSAAVRSVEFVDDRTLVSADRGGKTKVWNIATGEEKTEALAGSKFALSKQGKDKHKQQVGRFVCTAEGDLLLVHLLEAEDDEKGGRAQAGRLLPGAFADTGARLPRRGDSPGLQQRRGAAAAGGGAADVSVRTSSWRPSGRYPSAQT